MSFGFQKVSAHEILDSRGRPTLSVTVELGDGSTGAAGVPSGASTGTREAVELRDGDQARFSGAGVLNAVEHVNGEIDDELRTHSWQSLEQVDGFLAAHDGTPNKGRRQWTPAVSVRVQGSEGSRSWVMTPRRSPTRPSCTV